MGLLAKETSKLQISNTKLLLQKYSPNLILLVIFITLIFLTVVILSHPFQWQLNTLQTQTDRIKTVTEEELEESEDQTTTTKDQCDIFTGEWVPNPNAPYYTNTTCWAIHKHQNCMKYGRPDSEFIKWRWKPDGCELPLFDPAQFLEVVRGKSMAFVGDSVGRNQMESLICLLSRVQHPINDSRTGDEGVRRWKYPEYNFTVALFWSPHLVRVKEADTNGPNHNGLFNIYLDEIDTWTAQIDEFDYVILSGGHWFLGPSVFYEDRKIVGCQYCQMENVTDLSMFYYSFRMAFRTALGALNSRKNYRGITYLRTYSPTHYEGGTWNQGGDCVRTRPFKSNETRLSDEDWKHYSIQIEEFSKAAADGRKRGKKVRLLDTTRAMLLRPDGHPRRYGHWVHQNVTMHSDCLHWCLPGPIDSWSDLLLQMLKMEGPRLRAR